MKPTTIEIASLLKSSSRKRKRHDSDFEEGDDDYDAMIAPSTTSQCTTDTTETNTTLPSASKKPMTTSINRRVVQKSMAYPWSKFLEKIQDVKSKRYSPFKEDNETKLPQSAIDELESELQPLIC
jgi:hypothetical protein